MKFQLNRLAAALVLAAAGAVALPAQAAPARPRTRPST